MKRFWLLLLILPFLACGQTRFWTSPTATPTKTPRVLALPKMLTATARAAALASPSLATPQSFTATLMAAASNIPTLAVGMTLSPSLVLSTGTPTISPTHSLRKAMVANTAAANIVSAATFPPATSTPTATATSVPPTPTSPATSTPVPPTATPTRGAASSQKGLAVIASPACKDMDTLRATWYLNWGTAPDSTCDGDNEKFVPRISNAVGMQQLGQAIANARPSGWLIGFNEPNLSTQANMSPAQGAELWQQIEEAADAANIKLVSPSPNQDGSQWLWTMVDEYQAKYGQKPRFDALGWHIYGCTNNSNCRNVDKMKQYLIDRRQEAQDRGYHVPIWVLEYGGCLTNNSADSDKEVMQEMTAWFNQTDWISRYAWFSNRVSSSYQGEHKCILIDNGGDLTKLGQIYQGY